MVNFLQKIRYKLGLGSKKRYVQHQIEDFLRSRNPNRNPSEIINQKEIRVVGLRRTGNHAIINWIIKQHHGQCVYINDVNTKENPFRQRYEFQKRRNIQENIDFWKQESQGIFSQKDCLLYNYEDYTLQEIITPNFEQKHDLYFGKTVQRYDVLILRDPFNLLASRKRLAMRLGEEGIPVKTPKQTVVDLWLNHAREFLGETNILTQNKVVINYNRWVTEVSYREQIANLLDLEFTDAGLNEVKRKGGGSSFDLREFDGQANKMDINNRWKYFINDPKYCQLLNHTQLISYSEKIFGHLPETEMLNQC